MITSSSLRMDAQDNLEEFYAKEQELVSQIKIFEEALESARDDLKALRKEWRGRLRQAGDKSVQVKIMNLLELNQPIQQADLASKFSELSSLSFSDSSARISSLVAIGRIKRNESGLLTIATDWKDKRGTKTGIGQNILSLLRSKDVSMTVNEVGKEFPDFSIGSVRACLNHLVNRGLVTKTTFRTKCMPNTYIYREPVPKREPVNETITG